MAETATEKKVCPKCGVEVRPNTLFCYNCGSAVGGAAFPTVKDALLEEERAEKSVSADKMPSRNQKLTSAAALKQRKNSAPNKPVEVVWEEPDSAPNPWFLAVALLLTLFAVGVFVIMLRIR